MLPPKPKRQGGKIAPQKIVNPYIQKNENGYEITPAGKSFLNKTVTSAADSVYSFSEALSPVTIAAAMARLSRRGDDMRVTILDEFANNLGKDEQLLHRVITAYGDDSVQQLVGQHIVVEGASNLLTKKLEWGRLASYLEQSTRYIYFDQKDEGGNYKYFTPEYLDKETKHLYREVMDQIFRLYSDMVQAATKHVRDNSTVPKEEQDIAWQGATRAQACDAIRPSCQ
jgi:thymidylate synthase ThyX